MKTLIITTSALFIAVRGRRRRGPCLPRPCGAPRRQHGTTAPRRAFPVFTQKLEPAFSTVEVRDANGTRVDQGKARSAPTRCVSGSSRLPPGTYKVHWHALSVDTHTTEGTFTFQVGQ